MRKWGRPAFACGLALIIFLQIDSRYSAAEDRLARSIGELRPTATALSDIPAGVPLDSAPIGFPKVPVRWRPPTSFADQQDLDGLVSAVAIRAGVMLGPETTRGGSAEVSRPLRSGERIISTLATAPAGLLRPGMFVEVMVTATGQNATIASRRALLISVKELDESDSSRTGGVGKVQAEIREGEKLALRLANAEAAGSEIRLVPTPGPN